MVCLAGGLPLYFLHVPGGNILGAMAAAAVVSIRGYKMGWPPVAYAAIALILGTASGASVTPAILKQASAWPISIAMLLGASVVMCVCGYAVLRLVGRLDPRTAFFAVAPGALQTVLILAEEQKADLAVVGMMQTLRMVVLLLVIPPLLGASVGASGLGSGSSHGLLLTGEIVRSWSILITACVLTLLLARRLKWPSAEFLGPMVASALLHLLGVVAVKMPPVMTLAAGACMGLTVGARFAGLSLSRLANILALSAVVLVVMGAISASAGAFAGHISGVGSVAGVLAFAPGSLDAMIALALAFGAQPAYVAAHHLSRFMMLMVMLPLVSRWLFRLPNVALDAAEPAATP